MSMFAITDFHDGYTYLSNFSSHALLISGQKWPTVEHAFQAAKTTDRGQQQMIRAATSPGLAKRLGKTVTLRPNWNDMRVRVMEKLVALKFAQWPELGLKLRATGDALIVEGNKWHDNFWGSCSCPRCQHITGENHLGLILMQIRRGLSW
jgi:ribA/ribD-fused uncharacterized protein